MNKLKKVLLISSLVFFGVSFQKVAAQDVSPDNDAVTKETKRVVEHHLEAFAKGDVQETLKDYNENSVIITKGVNPRGYVRGLAEIGANFDYVYKNMFLPGKTDLKIIDLTIVGEIAYMTWTSTTTDFTTDTLVVRDGKIVAQTFAGVFKK